MKLYKTVSLLVLGLGAGGLVASSGCGGSKESDSAAKPDAGGVSREPPTKPTGAPASDTPARTFAMNQLFLGETGRNGAPLKDAWRDYGFNLDGLFTTKTDTNVCQRQAGADSSKQEDGKEGIDNSFGRTVLGFILGLVPTPSKTINDSIQTGTFTIILELKGLTDDPAQTNNGITGRVLVGGTFEPPGTNPNFGDPSLDWPYRPNPVVPLDDGYITNGTYVNGARQASVQLSLFIQGRALNLTIHRAAITFQHQPPNDLANGTIAGIIDTNELVSGIEQVAGRISEQLCGGSTLETIKQTIRQASDILEDGTNSPGVPCNGISIGIGFTGKRIGAVKTISKDPVASPDPCLDGGAGDGG